MIRPTDEQLKQWGLSLREIDPSSLVPDEDGSQVRWFLGDNATEFFVWFHPESGPHHLQLVFSRVSVEWDNKRGLVTGTFKDGSSAMGGRYDPYLLSIGQRVDLDVCSAALVLLGAATVDASLRAPLLQALQKVGT
ncbi:MAG: hypothetical protein K1X64_16050 [Myxococcaceae bacterium]|nr:hypothetical protein [Myxococcaceae bacterium]